MIQKKWWVFASIFTLSLALFQKSLSYYFFQDDWFVLSWISNEGLPSYFSFRTDIIYWRPLTMPIFFAIGKGLFGLNPLGFHLIAFTFHCINICLVYLLMRQLHLKQVAALFAAFIWGISAFHFVPLSWLSTTSYIIGPTFILSTVILFLKSKYKTSVLFFILALCSTELSLITPALILILDANIKKKFKKLLPFFILVIPYLVVRFVIFPAPTRSDYAPSINLKLLTNAFWYFAWNFNMAERFSTIFYLSNIKSSVGLIREFASLLAGPLFLMVSFMALLLKVKPAGAIVIRGIAWFMVGLSPVIFLTNHAYAMYLAIASLGIIYMLAKTIDALSRFKVPVIITLGSIWFASSAHTVNFLTVNHWIPNEQAVSRAYSTYTKEEIPNPVKDSTFVFRNAQKTFQEKYKFTLLDSEDIVYQSLNGNTAMQVLYNEPSLKSIFLKSGQQLSPNPNQIFYEILPQVK
ncbi:MAG: hypothetical protein WD988_00945 [Candidatus Curtissbacteria bacterium]